jgi:S-adenosylmethionine uptake transporter
MPSTKEVQSNVFQNLWTWINSKGYLQGVFWAVMVCLISSLNDVFTRLSGTRLDTLQVSFFRFFFSMITLIPIMLYYDRSSFKTVHWKYHSLRATMGYGAIACWVYGVSVTPLSIASLMAQTVGLFVLVMAFFLLREKVGLQRTLATVCGMIGILITIRAPGSDSLLPSFSDLNTGPFWLLVAAVMFAASDILNKVMVAKETHLTMLFYFAVGTTFIGAFPAAQVWQTPNFSELAYLLCLGAGANLILYCLLKAFSATEISALQPFRYVEILFATGFGFVLFGEVPTILTLIGAAIIIPSTLFIALYETRNQGSSNKDKGEGEDDKPLESAIKKAENLAA